MAGLAANTVVKAVRRVVVLARFNTAYWDPLASRVREGEARSSAPRGAGGSAKAAATPDSVCEFSIPVRRSRKKSDGGLHDAGAWSWLLDQLQAGMDAGFTAVRCVTAGGSDPRERRKFRVTLRPDAVGLLQHILEEACRRFYRKRIRARFLDANKCMEVGGR